MKKIYLTATLFTAFALTLAGCVNDGDGKGGPGDKDKFNVELAIVTPSTTRAVDDGIGGTDHVIDFSTGHLYFVASNGIITKYLEITSGSENDGTKIGIQLLKRNSGGEAGALISNVPGHSVKVYVAGNVPSAITMPTEGHIDNARGVLIDVISQYDAVTGGGVANATVFGVGTIDKTPVSPNPYKVTVTPAPLASRLEIEKFRAGGEIISYQIDGIFINNFLNEVPLNGAPSTAATNLIHYGESNETRTTYLPVDAGGLFPVKYNAVLYDYDAAGMGEYSGLECTPTENDEVWAYNLLATDQLTTPTVAQLPHIIVRLTNVETKPDSEYEFPGTQFITIRTYTKDVEGTPTAINKFEGGYVYVIEDFYFDETYLKDKGEVDDRDVMVYVQLLTWKTETLTPGL